jgi:hypothetical protein
MPAPEEIGRIQRALLWAAVGSDKYGEPRVSAAREIMVHWVETDSAGAGSEGGTNPYDATVIVGEPIGLNSLMWKGALEDWDPSVPQRLMQVIRYTETPDIKGRKYARAVNLRRYTNKLPKEV